MHIYRSVHNNLAHSLLFLFFTVRFFFVVVFSSLLLKVYNMRSLSYSLYMTEIRKSICISEAISTYLLGVFLSTGVHDATTLGFAKVPHAYIYHVQPLDL